MGDCIPSLIEDCECVVKLNAVESHVLKLINNKL